MKKSILSFDYHLQLIVFVLLMVTSVTIIPLMLLAPFGAYQVISAGVKGVALDKYRHRIFALVAGLYGTLVMFIAFEPNGVLRDFFNLFDDDFMTAITVVAYLIIPFISAVFYIRQSHKDWQEALIEEIPEEVFVS